MIVQKLAINHLKSAKDQIRKTFNEEELNNLAESLKLEGQQVPIKVRPNGPWYEIVFGHRRVAASKLAGFTTVLAIIEDSDDEMALIQQTLENESRQEVPYLERAKGYKNLLDKLGCNRNQLSKKIGVSEQTIRDALNVLEGCQHGVIANNNIKHKATLSVGRTADIVGTVKGSWKEKKNLADKSNAEELSMRQLREVITEYNNASGQREKDRVVKTRHPKLNGFSFRQQLRTASHIENKQKREERRDRLTGEPVVKDYTLAITAFSEAIQQAERFRTKFSPEAIRFIEHKHAIVTKKILNLEGLLND